MLNEQEKATMSGNFEAELQKNLASPQTPGEPTPMWRDNIPASAAGDLIAPTVTINGGPEEGVTTTQTAACFPLWVSDNRTPWQQLMSRAQLDTNQWSSWMNYFSYCFDNLGNGDHTVTIQVKDLAGNISANAQRRFSVKR